MEDNKLRLKESEIKRQENKIRFAEASFDIVKMCSDICEVLKGDFVDSFIKKSLWDIIEKGIINSCCYDTDSKGQIVPGLSLTYKYDSSRVRLSSDQEAAYYRVKNFISEYHDIILELRQTPKSIVKYNEAILNLRLVSKYKISAYVNHVKNLDSYINILEGVKKDCKQIIPDIQLLDFLMIFNEKICDGDGQKFDLDETKKNVYAYIEDLKKENSSKVKSICGSLDTIFIQLKVELESLIVGY